MLALFKLYDESIEKKIRKLRKDFQVSPQIATYYISLNLKRKPFDDLRVRQALAMVLDKKAIVEKILKAGQVPADEIVPSMTGYVGQKGVGYNPEQAKKRPSFESLTPIFPDVRFDLETNKLNLTIDDGCRKMRGELVVAPKPR